MKYRINFVANFDVDVEAENGSEARVKADEICRPGRVWLNIAGEARCYWNHIKRVDGADDD